MQYFLYTLQEQSKCRIKKAFKSIAPSVEYSYLWSPEKEKNTG
jgi:hypothetical protein